MSRFSLSVRYFASFSLAALVGCDTQPITTGSQNASTAAETNVVAVNAPSTENLPIVERAEYVNWSQFPIGTTVTHVRETKSDVDKVIVTTVSRLAVKTDKKVVIESQVTVDKGAEPLVNPPMEIEYGASFRLPPNMDGSKFALPSPDAKVTGEESVEFDGKKFPAVIYEWQGSSEVGPTENKMWFCKDIPGRVFQHEMKCASFSSSEKLAKIEIPAS